MGLWSWCCKGCGNSILCAGATNEINAWMNRAVAITPDESILRGSYDGYGRLNGREIDPNGDHEVALWHESCWILAGKPTEYQEPSKSAKDQGYFFDDEDYPNPDPLKDKS